MTEKPSYSALEKKIEELEAKLKGTAVQDGNAKYRILFEKSKDAILIIEDETFVECNQAAIDMLGYKNKTEFLNTHPSKLSPDKQPDGKDSFTKAKEMIAIALQNGSHRFEWDHIRVNKEVFPVEVLLTTIFQQENRHVIHTIWRDISAQKQTENQLLMFAKVIEQANEEVVVTNSDGVIQYVNPSFEKNTGYFKDEAIGQTPAILKSGLHDKAFYEGIWKTILNKKIWKGKVKNRCKNGHILMHDMVISPIVDIKNQISGFVSIRRDITEQKKLEKQIEQSRKMEAIGTLAGGIAHDFNNILSGIFGYAQLAQINITTPDKAKNNIFQITQGAKRAADLVQQILTNLIWSLQT